MQPSPPNLRPIRQPPSPDERLRAANRVTLLGAVVNVLLTVVKGLAGVLGGSAVMVADAVHSLSDLVSDVVAWLSLRIASAPPDAEHPYGHGRFETIGTVVLGLVLLSAAAGIAIDALERFGETAEPGSIALWAAAISIVAKEILYHVTVRVGRQHASPLIMANAWHHRTDALSSVAALAGIAGARMGFPILDPVAAIVVAALIVHVAIKLLRDAVREVTDSGLQREMLRDLGAGIGELAGVVNLHELRARRMGPSLLVDLHVEVDGRTTVSDGHQVAERVRQYVFAQDRNVTDVLVHIDPEPDQDLAPGQNLAPPRAEIDDAVHAVAARVDGVLEVPQVLVHFLEGEVKVHVHIDVDPELRVREADRVAQTLRRELEAGAGIDCAAVHLELGHDAEGPAEAHRR